MPFPSSSFGQPNWSDVYTAIPPGSGLQVGVTELLFDGSFVQFVLANASVTGNYACTPLGTFATTYSVTPTSATLQTITHINDRAGGGLGGTISTVAAASYAWMTISGLSYPFTTATTAAGKQLVSSATAGLTKGITAGTDVQTNLLNLVVVGASNAATPALFQGK